MNETTWPAFSIYLIPGKYSNARQLGFNWSVENFGPAELQIRLKFEQPDQVSAWQDWEKIGVTVYGFYLFADYRGNMMQPEYVLQTKKLTRQISLEKGA